MTPVLERKTAEERRQAILEAAAEEFARRGLHGASTDEIARQAGISQPYLFRLFGTKKELYVATVRRCLRETLETFQQAAEGLNGEEAMQAMGTAYGALLARRPSRLLAQMQAYAACQDDDVRTTVRAGYRDLFEFVERVSGGTDQEVSRFFATGMLFNVIAAMGLLESPEPWGERLRAGCFKEMA